MQQIQCSRCGYTLAGMSGSVAACPNCGQQIMIPGASAQAWSAFPGQQQAGNPYGAQTPNQPDFGTNPSYGQPAAPYNTPPGQYGQPSSPYNTPPGQFGQPSSPYNTPPGQYGAPSGAYGAPPQPGYTGMAAPSAPARRNPLIPIVLVVVLLLVAGGAYLFVKHNKSGGSLPSGYTLYTDQNGLYTIGYPGGWAKQSSGSEGISAVLFTNAARSDIFEIAELPSAGVTTSDLSMVLGQFFTGFAGSLPGGGGTVGNTSSPQNVTIAGQTWTQESGDVNYTDSGGGNATAHTEVSAISHKGHIFILADVTQDGSKFASEKSAYFTPMIDSFTFK